MLIFAHARTELRHGSVLPRCVQGPGLDSSIVHVVYDARQMYVEYIADFELDSVAREAAAALAASEAAAPQPRGAGAAASSGPGRGRAGQGRAARGRGLQSGSMMHCYNR